MSSSNAEMREIIAASVEFDPNSGCWLWARGLGGDGYGSLGFRGWPRRAHRASYEAHKAPLLPGASVLHSCDTPCCVNPAHLTQGTHAQNMADAARKGRIRQGAGRPWSERTHCIAGHPITAATTYFRKNGKHECCTCRAERAKNAK